MSEAASNSISSTRSAPARAWSIISWSAFLACSWTWCIGMWLPVILLRDFGIWSFAAFASPNVVGAAAMGVVLRKSGLSEWIASEHEFAARAFSVVTIAFQLFFFLWITGASHDFAASWKWLATTAVFVVGGAVIGFGHRWIRHVAVAVWLVSLVLLLVFALPRESQTAKIPVSELSANELLWLAPVLVLGFLLCPYLDLTFHRARRALPGPAGSLAFAIGFGLLFLTMIIGTLGYGLALLADSTVLRPSHLPAFVAVHIVLQLAFTIVAHTLGDGKASEQVGSLNTVLDTRRLPRNRMLMLGFVLGLCMVATSFSTMFLYAGLTATEIIYRGFMSFYGLIFPAYVWICMLPLGTTRTSRRVWTFAGAVVLASPFYWMGFIERETIWLVPGVAIVLFAKLIAGGAPRRSA